MGNYYDTPKFLSIIPQEDLQPLIREPKSRRALAKKFFNKAGDFDQGTHEGSISAWMHVLAARSTDDEGYLDWIVCL